MNNEVKNGIITSIAVVIIIAVVYFMTAVFLTGEIGGNKKTTDNDSSSSSTSQREYDNMIIAGRTFNQKEDTYMVIFFSEKEAGDSLKSAISSYSKDVKLYKVNVDEAINKYVVSETDNLNPTNSGELKVSKNALLTISSGVVTSYVNDDEKIISELE